VAFSHDSTINIVTRMLTIIIHHSSVSRSSAQKASNKLWCFTSRKNVAFVTVNEQRLSTEQKSKNSLHHITNKTARAGI